MKPTSTEVPLDPNHQRKKTIHTQLHFTYAMDDQHVEVLSVVH